MDHGIYKRDKLINMHAQNPVRRLLQQFSGAPEKAEPYYERSGEEGNHQMVGCWNHIPNIRQFMGEPSSMCSKEMRDNSNN